MKSFLTSILIIFCNAIVFSQNNEVVAENFSIKVISVYFHKDMFGIDEYDYGEDFINNPEKLSNLYVKIIIHGFDTNHPIDFNLFSIIENDYKIRQRPKDVFFRSYYLNKYDVTELSENDSFLKYKFDNIENHDHFEVDGFVKRRSSKKRLCILQIPQEKNKKGEFIILFPILTNKKGEFSLYYKDIFIKSFKIEKGFRLRKKELLN